MRSNSVSEKDIIMAKKAKAKTTKNDGFVSCAGSLKSMTGAESKMSTNKRWTAEPMPGGAMMKAKSNFAKK